MTHSQAAQFTIINCQQDTELSMVHMVYCGHGVDIPGSSRGQMHLHRAISFPHVLFTHDYTNHHTFTWSPLLLLFMRGADLACHG